MILFKNNRHLSEFFDSKTCNCERFKYQHEDYNWPNECNWAQPPLCRDCRKWDPNLVFNCIKCEQWFYRWFSHPRNGFYHKLNSDPIGWICYFCLESGPPVGLRTRGMDRPDRERIPPQEFLLPPGYTKAKEYKLPPERQAFLDEILAKLKGPVARERP